MMVETVRAWAAVAPDGTVLLHSISNNADRTWFLAMGDHNAWVFDKLKSRMEEQGWRVVEVEIKIKDN